MNKCNSDGDTSDCRILYLLGGRRGRAMKRKQAYSEMKRGWGGRERERERERPEGKRRREKPARVKVGEMERTAEMERECLR